MKYLSFLNKILLILIFSTGAAFATHGPNCPSGTIDDGEDCVPISANDPPSSVPEPSTLALFALGLGGLVVSRKYLKK